MTDEPTELRFDIPHSARVWNYLLGGNRLMAGVPSGSYQVLLDGGDTSDAVREATDVNGYNLRTLDQLRQCFEGLDMIEPGLVQSPQWRPAPANIGVAPEHVDSYCAVGRKP